MSIHYRASSTSRSSTFDHPHPAMPSQTPKHRYQPYLATATTLPKSSRNKYIMLEQYGAELDWATEPKDGSLLCILQPTVVLDVLGLADLLIYSLTFRLYSYSETFIFPPHSELLFISSYLLPTSDPKSRRSLGMRCSPRISFPGIPIVAPMGSLEHCPSSDISCSRWIRVELDGGAAGEMIPRRGCWRDGSMWRRCNRRGWRPLLSASHLQTLQNRALPSVSILTRK